MKRNRMKIFYGGPYSEESMDEVFNDFFDDLEKQVALTGYEVDIVEILEDVNDKLIKVFYKIVKSGKKDD